ncbi:hypothetical protein OG978_33670 [Streptomyces sp. NBC_01591]|uniref:hypothetical protein n=1 Tax=Streptomyces sp. NBC_01591 TaxID=2975888 RepID=UPI002DD9AFB2|nr:hypothetical protein [Streptomyces sp. NBC_01591]WSD71911.1 hypothetical protein OG978_33670 [Streptomyces sp. NBC_01591]
MTDSLDAAFAPLHAHLRAISDFSERYQAIRNAENEFENLKRAHLKEVAQGLRAEGKKWKEVAEIMGGVSYQRAFQYGQGE